MYTIYSTTEGKTVCLHDDLVADESVKVLDPKLELSDSAAGSLSFKLAPNNLAYGKTTVDENVVKSIEKNGAAVDLKGESMLEQGDIQNGVNIASDYSLRTANMIQVGDNDAVNQLIGTAEPDPTQKTLVQGIETGSGNALAAFFRGGIYGGVDKNAGKDNNSDTTALRTVAYTNTKAEEYISIKLADGETISDRSISVNVTLKEGVSGVVRFYLYFYQKTVVSDTVNMVYIGYTQYGRDNGAIVSLTNPQNIEIYPGKLIGNVTHARALLIRTVDGNRQQLNKDDIENITIRRIYSGGSPAVTSYEDWLYIPATSTDRAYAIEDYSHLDSKIPVTADLSKVRLHYAFKYATVYTKTGYPGFSQGGVSTNGDTVSLIDDVGSKEKYIRCGVTCDQNDFPFIMSSGAIPNFRVKITMSTNPATGEPYSSEGLQLLIMYVSSFNDGAKLYKVITVNSSNDLVAPISATKYFWMCMSYSAPLGENPSDIAPSYVDKVEFVFSPSENYYVGGDILLYSNDTFIGSPCEIEMKNETGYIDVSTVGNDGETRADYITMNLRQYPSGHGAEGQTPLNSSFFESSGFTVTTPFEFTVHQYDADGQPLSPVEEQQRAKIGPQGEGTVSFDKECKQFRITIKKAKDDETISTSDISTAMMQMMKTTYTKLTKELDLVGRLTSTITVKRSDWNTNQVSNGSYNLLAPIEIPNDEMEQGWYSIGAGINGRPYASELAIRTKEIIPVTLSSGDYISVQASIKDNSLVSTAESPTGESASSTYRRPCGFVLYFYNNNTCIGVSGSQGNPHASNSDVLVDVDDVTGVKICVLPIDGSNLSIDELDYIKMYTTNGKVENGDIFYDEAEWTQATDYVVKTMPLALDYEVNEFTNTWSAQLDAQSRQGYGIQWGVAMYNSSNVCLGVRKWFTSTDRIIGLVQGTKYVRVLLRYGLTVGEYGTPMGANDISVLNVNFYRISNTRVESLLWEGRVLSEEVDFRKCRVITCEGALAYLNDTRQAPRVYTNITFKDYITKLLEAHNSKVKEDRRIYVGSIWEPTKKKETEYGQSQGTSEEEDIHRHVTNFETTLELINQLVNDFGGHLRLYKDGKLWKLDWLENYNKKSNQVIRFGENLLDFTQNYDMSKMCTAVYPTGNVLVEAKSSAVGDHIEKTDQTWVEYKNTLMYYGDDGRVYRDTNAAGYLTVCATVETSTTTESKSYYFSARLHGGFVACWVTDDVGNMYSGMVERAGDENPGFVDYLDKEITMPVGCTKVWICSFGNAIPVALKKQIKETQGVDELLTISDVATDKDANGKVWHTKGSPYISNPDMVDKYGWIEHRLDLSNVKDKDALYTSAKNYIKNSQFEEVNLEVSAIDLNSLGVDVEFIDLLDEVRVVSEPHGLDKFFPVTSMSIPLNDPAGQKFTLGTKNEVTLSGQHASSNTELLQKIEAAPSTESVIRSAFATAAEAINAATTGSYINYIYDANGRMCELVISNAEPTDPNDITSIPPTAQVWRWNSAGLGHSNHGYVFDDNNLNMALTAEGRVIANEIFGEFLKGLGISGSYLQVGPDGPVSRAALEAIMPKDENNKPKSALTVRSGLNTGSYVDLCDGGIQFGSLDSGSRDEFGHISVQSIVQGDFTNRKGLIISGPKAPSGGQDYNVLVFDAYDIGVGTGSGLSNVRQTVGSNGTDVTLTADTLYSITVRNGMIIGYTERSNNSE